MPRLKHRLLKLEAIQPRAVEQFVIVFSVIDADGTPLQVIGYSFHYGTVTLLPSESQEQLRERAIAECQQAMPDSPVIILKPLIEA